MAKQPEENKAHAEIRPLRRTNKGAIAFGGDAPKRIRRNPAVGEAIIDACFTYLIAQYRDQNRQLNRDTLIRECVAQTNCTLSAARDGLRRRFPEKHPGGRGKTRV
jgi:hypothetical protein